LCEITGADLPIELCRALIATEIAISGAISAAYNPRVATDLALAVEATSAAALAFLAAQLETLSGFSEVLASLEAGRAGMGPIS
jgi:hypothetical protein